ncbi:MAG: hypothetical protein WDZ30_11070 [Cellvibrionaceae bacterium]
MRLISFSCVGFDVRQWPCTSLITADATCWPQNENSYEKLLGDKDLFENRYQLIQPKTDDAKNRLYTFAKDSDDINLIAILLPEIVVEVAGGPESEMIEYNFTAWTNYGIDVCDLNGFFSILHTEVVSLKSEKLFPESKLLEALELVQLANILVPSHAPFVTAKVLAMK